MSLEQKLPKKLESKSNDQIDLNSLSREERLEELKLRAYELQHYPLSHLPTTEKRNQGITEGPTYPEYVTKELVEDLITEEIKEFLSSITVPEVKQASLEPSNGELTLKYYAQDPGSSFTRPESVSQTTINNIKKENLLRIDTYAKYQITQKGLEKLQLLEKKRDLVVLFTTIQGMDLQKSAGHITVSQFLNSFVTLNKYSTTLRATDITNSFTISNGISSYILHVLSRSENSLFELKEKVGNNLYYSITERGREFAAKASELLTELGEPLLLNSRAKEQDINHETIEGIQHFRFPQGVFKIKNILEVLQRYDFVTREEIEQIFDIIATNRSLTFLSDFGYVTRERIRSNSVGREAYQYSMSNNGIELYELLIRKEKVKALLEDQFQKEQFIESYFNTSFLLETLLKIINYVQNNAQSVAKNIKGSSSSANLPHLENILPALLYSEHDPDSKSGNPRKLYSLTEYAEEVVMPVIREYEEVEFKLLQEVKQWEAAGYKFY